MQQKLAQKDQIGRVILCWHRRRLQHNPCGISGISSTPNAQTSYILNVPEDLGEARLTGAKQPYWQLRWDGQNSLVVSTRSNGKKAIFKKNFKDHCFYYEETEDRSYGLTTDVLRDILRQNSEGISTIFQVFSQIKKTSSSQGHSYRPRNSACLYSLFHQPCPF